jgi:hypothetical protein
MECFWKGGIQEHCTSPRPKVQEAKVLNLSAYHITHHVHGEFICIQIEFQKENDEKG